MITEGSQMAKMTKAEKAAAKRARNKFKGINVTDFAIGYGGLAIWTDALLMVDPIQFFTDKAGAGNSYRITGRELLDSIMGGAGGVGAYLSAPKTASNPTGGKLTSSNAFSVIERNAKVNGLNAVGKSIVYGVVTGLGKKATTKPRNFLNKNLKQFGLGKYIKF